MVCTNATHHYFFLTPCFSFKVFLRYTFIFVIHLVHVGISLWDAVASNVINSKNKDPSLFFEAYSVFPPALHSVYLFLLSVVLVTTIDRWVLPQKMLLVME